MITRNVLFVLTWTIAKAVSADSWIEQQPNTQVVHVENETSLIEQGFLKSNRANIPTRIIRSGGSLTVAGVSCSEVQEEINQKVLSRIKSDNFMYNTLTYCTYDPVTEWATNFSINSYFDPLNEDSEAVAVALEQEINGSELFGVPIEIERAKGVVISLEMNAAREDAREESRILRLRRDFTSLYFANNYDVNTKLISDVRARFYSNNPNKILPFIHDWFHPGLARVYNFTLAKANLVELMPERIFLMQKDKEIFTSGLHMYYNHHCDKYSNKKCL